MKAVNFLVLALVFVSAAQVGRADGDDQPLESSGRELASFGKKFVKFCDDGCGHGYYCKVSSLKVCGFKKVCEKKKVKTCLYFKKFYAHGKVFKKCVKFGFKFVTDCDDKYVCGYKVCAKKTFFGKKVFKKKAFFKRPIHG